MGAIGDFRLLVPALAGYAGALAGASGVPLGLILLGAGALGVGGLGVVRGRGRLIPWAATLAMAAAGLAGSMHLRDIHDSVVTRLANQQRFVHVALRVTGDPRVREGKFGRYVVVRARITVSGIGPSAEPSDEPGERSTAAPVLVIAPESWRSVQLGSRLEVSGRLKPADSPELAAVLTVQIQPQHQRGPPRLFRVADRLRASIVAATAGAPSPGGVLVPGLVVGDDSRLPEQVISDFRMVGMTHLTAVSGTNLTLVVGFLLAIARSCGIRGRALIGLGALGVVGFVLLARPEPSVLRAAVMGSVGLLSLAAGPGVRSARTLGIAVLLLVLVDPFLTRAPGFVLSVLATAGIVFLAPVIRDALSGWCPRLVAEAIAVPLAAQLACTPVVAAIGGGVSLVAVVANLAAAPLVGPATILGLAAGMTRLGLTPVGDLIGWLAGLVAQCLVVIADRGAELPGALIPWPQGVLPILALTLLCCVAAIAVPLLAARPLFAIGACLLMFLALLVRVPTPGWPPPGWIAVQCAVGQGDSLVLRTGPNTAVLVDTGPAPDLVDRCLSRLGVDRLALIILTHFHADHVDGLSGALGGREVKQVWISPLAEPADRADAVADLLPEVSVRAPMAGETHQVGEVELQVLAPIGGTPSAGVTAVESSGEGSGPNNASLVVLAVTQGTRLLLTGDIEPEAQQHLARVYPGLGVDVLKVPHHGSRNQDAEWIVGLGARLALIGVGSDNDYGHPAPQTQDLLRRAGMTVARTDQDGDIAVVVRDQKLGVVTLG